MSMPRQQLRGNGTMERKATAKEWLGLAVIALPCMLYSMDLTVLNLALPRIAEELRPSAAQLLWIVDIYGFLVAGALITMGTLGDRIGRRRLLMAGAAAFGLASVLAAFSTSAAMLIVARALLGLAAATLAPSTLSLISNMFPDERERRFAIGVWIASFSTGAAIGPVVGGLMLTWFWWGSVFLLAVPVMCLLLVLAPVLLPEYRDENAGRLDVASAALSLAAVLAVIYGLKTFAVGEAGLVGGAALAAGVLLGAAFVLRQRRIAEPLVDLAIFRIPSFTAALTVNVLSFFAAFGSFMLIAQYLQLVLGLTPLEAGFWSVPGAACFVAGSTLTPRLTDRVRPGLLMTAGLVVAAAAFAMLAAPAWPLGIAGVVAASCLLSLGLAPVFTLTTDVVLSAVPPQRAGIASGLSETSSEFGGALGIAVLGSLVTAVYRMGMGAAQVDGAQADGTGTLAGALGVAATFPEAARAELTVAAREAFGTAFSFSAAAAGAVLLVAAAIAAVTIARPPVRQPAGAVGT